MKLYYESKPGELKHGLKNYGSSTPRMNHKYIKKTPIGNGKYRYFYSQEEYDNFMKVRDKIAYDGFKPSSKYFDARVDQSTGQVVYSEKKGGLEAMNRDTINSIEYMESQDTGTTARIDRSGRNESDAKRRNEAYENRNKYRNKPKNASKEYWDELNYNSQKNVYSGKTKKKKK